MEDAFSVQSLGNEAVFGVFDGHYGKRAAIYASENLPRVLQDHRSKEGGETHEKLKNGFLSLDKQLLDKSRAENWHDGTTALVALLTMTDADNSTLNVDDCSTRRSDSSQTNHTGNPEVTSSASSSEDPCPVDQPICSDDGLQHLSMFIANSGDCRAISVYGDGRLFQLTTDHTPLLPYERWRIFKAGGNVKFGRIEGKLSVSRGFGDRQFKEPKALVSALPEVVSFKVTQNLRFVILACDGVWGWLNNMQVGKFVAKLLKEGLRPESVCKELVKYAYDQGSTDNISVVLLYFTFQTDPCSPASASQSPSLANSSSSLPVPQTANLNPSGSPPATPAHQLKSSDSGKLSKKSKAAQQHHKLATSTPSIPSPASKTEMGRPSTPSSESDSGMRASSIRSSVPLTASARSKKFNFGAAADSTQWTLDVDLIDRRADRALVITTHIATGEVSVLEQSEYDSTSEVEALDPRPSIDTLGVRYLRAPRVPSPPPRRGASLIENSEHGDETEARRSKTPLSPNLSDSESAELLASVSASPSSSRRAFYHPTTPKTSAVTPLGADTSTGPVATDRSPAVPKCPPKERRVSALPTDDDDDYQKPTRTSSSPISTNTGLPRPNNKKSKSDAMSPSPVQLRQIRRAKKANYELSDSESSSGEDRRTEEHTSREAQVRRRSLDDEHSAASSLSDPQFSILPPTATKAKPKRKHHLATTPKSKKKHTAPLSEASRLDDEKAHRRPSSFDATRPVKKSRGKKQKE